MKALTCPYFLVLSRVLSLIPNFFPWSTFSMVKDSSVVAVQIFDQRKFKRRDQGFLGVVNVQVANHLDFELDSLGISL